MDRQFSPGMQTLLMDDCFILKIINLKKHLVVFFIFFSFSIFAQTSGDRQLADQYLNNSEYAKAAELYDRLMNADPYGTYPQYLRCLLALKNYEDAEKLAKKIIKKMPDYPAYIVDLGFVYHSLGEEEKARQQYEKAIKLMKPDQGVIMGVANSFLLRQELDYALQVYLEGKKLLRGSYSFSFETADVYFQKGEFAKMTDEYVHENPWKAAGVGAGVGLIIGMLISRGR